MGKFWSAALVAAVVLTGSVSTAEEPEPPPPPDASPVKWKMGVSNTQGLDKRYGMYADGGKVPLSGSSWACRYQKKKIRREPQKNLVSESYRLSCSLGEAEVGTVAFCTYPIDRSRPMGEGPMAMHYTNLMLSRRGKPGMTMVHLSCEVSTLDSRVYSK